MVRIKCCVRRYRFRRLRKTYASACKKLYEETGFSGFGRNELDLQIRTYCEFLMRAAFFETVKEPANAFLYRVIALDMLLGSGS